MWFKPIIFIVMAFGLLSLSHSLELQGDLAPFAKDGVSTDQAFYHATALLALLGALGLFVGAGVSLFRTLRDMTRQALPRRRHAAPGTGAHDRCGGRGRTLKAAASAARSTSP